MNISTSAPTMSAIENVPIDQASLETVLGFIVDVNSLGLGGEREAYSADHGNGRRSSQEQWWAERNEPIEVAERPVGHEEVDPPIEAEAAAEEVPHGDLVRRRDLELEAFEAHRVGEILDVQQDGRQV